MSRMEGWKSRGMEAKRNTLSVWAFRPSPVYANLN